MIGTSNYRRVPHLIEPDSGHAHFGCRKCGNILMLPWEPGESMPWCVHNGYSWRAPVGHNPMGWTQMVPVLVKEDV